MLTTTIPSSARRPAAAASTATDGSASRTRSVMSPLAISAVIVRVVASSPNASKNPDTAWQHSSRSTARRSTRQASASALRTSWGSRLAMLLVVTGFRCNTSNAPDR